MSDIYENFGDEYTIPGGQIPPDRLAPDISNEDSYHASEDEEILQESKRLKESKVSDVYNYIKSGGIDFDGFMSSKWSNEGIKSPSGLKSMAKYLYDQGKISENEFKSIFSANEGTKKGPSRISASDRSNDSPATEAYEFDSTPTAVSDKLSRFMQSHENDVSSDSKGVHEQYEDMRNIVRNICLGRSLKRHAIIYGDPGVGKCLGSDTKITIQVEDCLKNELESYSTK